MLSFHRYRDCRYEMALSRHLLVTFDIFNHFRPIPIMQGTSSAFGNISYFMRARWRGFIRFGKYAIGFEWGSSQRRIHR